MKSFKIKRIRPLTNQVLTTANKYSDTELKQNGLILDIKKSEGNYKLYQKVIAVGPMVRNVKVGDWIMINPIPFIRVEHPEDEDSLRGVTKVRNTYNKMEFPIIEINSKEYMLLHENNAEYVLEDFEE